MVLSLSERLRNQPKFFFSELDPTVESGGGDLQTIQIDDYVDLDSSLHQESNVDPEKTDDDDDEKATSVENDDDDDNNVNDRSTETITANDFVIERPCEPEADLEVEPEPR